MASRKVSNAVDEMGMPIPKGGGMPAATVAAPLIGAGASVIGGLLGNHAQSNANKAQAAATDKAMAYQREQDALKRKDYEEAKKRFAFEQKVAWGLKKGALARYGIQMPDFQEYPGDAAPGGAPGAVPRQPVTLGTIARAIPPVGPGMQGQAPPGAPVGPAGDPSMEQDPNAPPDDWSNWRRYA